MNNFISQKDQMKHHGKNEKYILKTMLNNNTQVTNSRIIIRLTQLVSCSLSSSPANQGVALLKAAQNSIAYINLQTHTVTHY